MPDIIRNRTIRPSTRLASSINYRVDIKGISTNDTLIVNIKHESRPFHKIFRFKGSDVLKRKSLGFRVRDFGPDIEIIWDGTQPVN